jgi:hypothetical protein
VKAAQAEAIVDDAMVAKEEEVAPPSERKKIRQEEARLGTYVASAPSPPTRHAPAASTRTPATDGPVLTY